MRIEGKPQCHVVALAKEQNALAASVGCALSRARTAMRSEEMTCVIPGGRWRRWSRRSKRRSASTGAMASYASADAKRFG